MKKIVLFSMIILSFTLLSCSKDKDEESATEQTSSVSTIVDKDGNSYKTVIIGTQTWTSENLKSTHLNDGTSLKLCVNVSEWSTCNVNKTPACCAYNFDNSNIQTYGLLYNWYAINTGKLAPSGWRVASLSDWATLQNCLGTKNIAVKLKAVSNLWTVCDSVSNSNTSGFNAIPSGGCEINGNLYGTGNISGYWTTDYDSSISANAWIKELDYWGNTIQTYSRGKTSGFSVRVVKQ
jgi:uncharacterized protein (TIGR02145 family)